MADRLSKDSKRVSFVMPKKWYEEVEKLAKSDDRNPSQWIRLRLRDALKREGASV